MSYTNRLIHATSPYLLQHASNPVDWYEWGPEALQKARNEDKPILLSVGYAACHWCHVMAHESFEDPATAAVMNELFVNVKVDREERPDIDSIYMTAVVAMTRHGGWPMTVFLLPDGTPFFGGTYFPPEEKAAQYGMLSFKSVLRQVADAYQNRRNDVVQAGQELISHMQQQTNRALPASSLEPDLLDKVINALAHSFDRQYGGFGGAPKFPQPMTLEFLLRMYVRTQNSLVLEMLELTLDQMAHGGIYDQLGGGFHRYSVDERWLVPHFEKMLYDNAQLARIYVEAFQVTGVAFYRHIAEETLDYMVREMLHPDGGFYSTQDADSPHDAQSPAEEGVFFVWTPEEVREVLGEDALLFCQIYDVTTQGNFEGRNILHLPRPLTEIARVTGASVEQIRETAERGRRLLWTAREQRIKPARDEKILTAWNGMALRAFVAAAAAFDRADYLTVAQRNADFLITQLQRADGRVLRSWKDGTATLNGYLEDYALLADGLLALYLVDGQQRWLNEAVRLIDATLELFWDNTIGGFYDTASDHEKLITRPRDITDNATPSGTSVAVDVLLRLDALLDNDTYRLRARQVLSGAVEMIRRFPTGFGRMLCAADFALARVREVAFVGVPGSPDLQALQRVLFQNYQPHLVVAYKFVGPSAETSDAIATPLLESRTQIDNTATAYVCEGFVCKLPVTSPEALEAQLAE